jgi:hypothetical protein
MKRMLSLCSLCLILAAAITTTYGDIARPSPSPAKGKIVLHTSLVVVPEKKASAARLQIPESSMRELRAALTETSGNESMTQRIAHSSGRTVIAGLLMFLSLSFGGVWLARSVHTRSQKTMAAFLIGIAVIGAAAIITRANAGPPPAYLWRRLPENFSKGQPTYGGVDIEIVPDANDGSGMKLIIPSTNER